MSLEPSSPERARRRASARAIRERTNSIRACYGSASWNANRSFRPLQVVLAILLLVAGGLDQPRREAVLRVTAYPVHPEDRDNPSTSGSAAAKSHHALAPGIGAAACRGS